MCVININLTTTTPNGTNITGANGRYRKVGQTPWNNFTINLLSPSTPNITVTGTYELQVNVVNNLGVVSDWASGSFEISESCGGGTATIGLGGPACRESGNCNDNAYCAMIYNVLVENANAGDYITAVKNFGTADISVTQPNAFGETPQIRYEEPNGFGSVNFDLTLRDASGAAIVTSTFTLNHQSFWNNIPFCSV